MTIGGGYIGMYGSGFAPAISGTIIDVRVKSLSGTWVSLIGPTGASGSGSGSGSQVIIPGADGYDGFIDDSFYLLGAAGIIDTGRWIDVPYNSANFTASGTMVWDVQSGDQAIYKYFIFKKMMFLAWKINASSITGTLSDQLRLKVPNGAIIAASTVWPTAYFQSAWIQGWAEAVAGETFIRIQREGLGGTNFALSTNSTYAQGMMILETQ